MTISCASGGETMPRIACRVVCGLADAIAILLPTRALVNVDLPAFGRPTKQAKPERNVPRSEVVERCPSTDSGRGPPTCSGLRVGSLGPGLYH